MLRIAQGVIALQLLFGGHNLGLAQESDPCDDDRGHAILRCSEKRLAEARKEMVFAQSLLRKKIHPSRIKPFDDSEKLWRRYVAGYCSVAADPRRDQPNNTTSQVYWGMATENYCHLRLIVERTGNLNRLLACIQDGGSENCS